MNGNRSKSPHWNRREVLQTGLKGGAAAMAAAYGLRPDFALAQVPNEFDGSKFQLAAPEANPKRGGVLRYGITSPPPHFDVHQSGTINSLGCQGCMFDNLVRRDPRDSGKTIIPDLAHSWQISKDGTTYTFHLRKDVQFHDGAEFTADDIKATYDRIRKPPTGMSIPRSILFSSVSEINVRDKHTIEFKLSQPRPASFIMSGFASGWNVIFRKKTLEDNQLQLAPRRRHSGHRAVQEQAPGRERSVGDGAQPELLEQGAALSGRPRVLSRPSVLARARLCRSLPAARTMRASSIPSPRARPRPRPACPRSTTIRA